MRKAAIAVMAAGLASAMLLSACSSSKPSTPTTSGSAGGSASSGGKIGVILPDTTSSTRYTLYDAPLLTKAIQAAGLSADVQNAGGSTSKFSQIADSMITEGVKVLIIDSIDPTSGAAVEQKAKNAGIKVIDYDRVNIGGSASYYVSFDNEGVGKLQGQTLADCLAASGMANPQVILMDGGT
ncbi:MAG: D-xylose transport system substrate-binding protein, partial [Pseudonocardiales bacterium]|nr:D-xylose transport system substrate-binding protein [Pseudonocardiales bacterium]